MLHEALRRKLPPLLFSLLQFFQVVKGLLLVLLRLSAFQKVCVAPLQGEAQFHGRFASGS